MHRKKLVILGAGGMAREILWLIRDLNRVAECYEFLGYVVSDLSRLGPHDSRDQLLGDYEWLTHHADGIDAAAIGIGTPAPRLKVAAEVARILPRIEWPALVHPTAVLDRDTLQLGIGAQICARAVLTVNVTLAPFALCNFACTLGHEVTVGAGSVINPGANVSGGVSIGDSVLVGSGAQILQYRKVGAGSIVGAGAVVSADVPAGVTVVGIPARPLVAPTLLQTL